MRLFGPIATDRGERFRLPHHFAFSRPLAAACARLALLAGLFGVSLTTAPRAEAQAAGGTISGRVTDAATGNPVSQVRVLVAGTQNGTLTAENGRYTLRVTNTGSVTLDVNRIGYEAQKITVTVGASPVVADVQIKHAAFSLAAERA